MSATLDAEIQRLLETDRAWAEAARGDDIDRICSFWSDDAVLFNMLGTGMRIEGIEDIRGLVTRSRSTPGRSLSWTPREAFVSLAGDVGATRGTHEHTAPGPDGTPVTKHGTYFNVWKKNANGEWKCAFETHSH